MVPGLWSSVVLCGACVAMMFLCGVGPEELCGAWVMVPYDDFVFVVSCGVMIIVVVPCDQGSSDSGVFVISDTGNHNWW